MLPTDFANLRPDSPELRRVLERVEQWVRVHPGASFIDLRRLTSELEDVPATELAVALTVLVETGKLRRVYKVVAPTTRTFADGDFDSPMEIPSQMRDTFDDLFDTRNAEIIQVYRGVGA